MPLFYPRTLDASFVTAGTFGAGDYVFPSDVTVTDMLQGTTGNGFLDVRGDSGASLGMRLKDNGRLLIGTTTAATSDPSLDIVSSFVGAICLADTAANTTNKISGMCLRHYTNSEEPVAIFGAASLSGNSILGYGGGNASLNTVRQHSFYTAANDTTVTGTEVMRLDFSTTATQTRMLVYDVDNATLERVTVGAADSGGVGFKVLRIPN